MTMKPDAAMCCLHRLAFSLFFGSEYATLDGWLATKNETRMKKLDLENARASVGSRYPGPFDKPCQDKVRYRLAAAAGLKDIGVNLLRLSPGAWSSQRHWHTKAEEFIYVVAGEITLVTEAGEEVLRAGEFTAFLPGIPDGHHLQNRSDSEALIIEIGSAKAQGDEATYPDIDLKSIGSRYYRKNGTPY
jgi:uncharacterized cupin superfamily protein